MRPDANMGHARAVVAAVAPGGRSQKHPSELNCLNHSLAGNSGSVVEGDGGREQNLMRQHSSEVRSLGSHWCMLKTSPKKIRLRTTIPVAWSWLRCYIEKMDTDPEKPTGREVVKAWLAASGQRVTSELPATPVHSTADALVMTA